MSETFDVRRSTFDVRRSTRNYTRSRSIVLVLVIGFVLVLVLVLVIGPIRRIRPIGRSGQVQGIRSKTGTVTISPYRLVCPFALYPSQRHGLSGEGFDGKWW